MNSKYVIGLWESDTSDCEAIAEYGVSSLEFFENGILIYTIYNDGNKQIMNLSYKLSGNYLVTNQASSPREERTLFHLRSDGKLVLDYGGFQSVYIKRQ